VVMIFIIIKYIGAWLLLYLWRDVVNPV